MNKVLAELALEGWAMEPKALYAFLQQVESSVPSGWGVSAAARFAGERPVRMSVTPEGVASIPISGVLLKSVPSWARFWGINATGYDEITSDLEQAMADPKVKSIRLAVSSPGGQVSGVKEVSDALFEAAKKKDVTADINDVGASAAYWLASQADRITANPNAIVGSLGCVTAMVDTSKLAEDMGLKVHLIASGPHKGVGTFGTAISAEQLKPAQELIDGMAASFAGDVVRGRGLNVGEEKHKDRMDKWMSGTAWLADVALSMGLIDEVRSATEAKTSPGGPAAAKEDPHKGGVMALDEKELAAATEKAKGEADRANQDRVKAITAEFTDDPGFALAEIGKGSTLAEAKANYSAVLRERLKTATAKNAELEAKAAAPAARPTGAPALPVGGEPGARQEKGFMETVEQYAKDNQCSKTEAMQKLAKGEPGFRNSELFLKDVGAHFAGRNRAVSQ